MRLAAARAAFGETSTLRVGNKPLLVRLGLAQADDFVTLLVLAALGEKFDALETLQDVALRGDGALAFEAAMLRHKKKREDSVLKRDADYTDIPRGEKGKMGE
jgi:hypothetical protein